MFVILGQRVALSGEAALFTVFIYLFLRPFLQRSTLKGYKLLAGTPSWKDVFFPRKLFSVANRRKKHAPSHMQRNEEPAFVDVV